MSKKAKKNLREQFHKQNFKRKHINIRLQTTLITVAILALYFFITILNKEIVYEQANNLRISLTESFDYIFVWAINIAAIVLVVLAIIPSTGKLRIGGEDKRPEFSTASWYAMLFSAGVGIGLLFYGVYEPLNHMYESPFYPNASPEINGIATSIFHWGFSGWGVYGIVALSLGYYAYNKDLPLAPRSFLYPLIKEKIYGLPGDMFDAFTIISSLFALASSLGIGAMQINAGFTYLFGIPTSIGLQVILIIVITAIATISIITGIDKGVRILSEANIYLAAFLLIVVLFATDSITAIQNTFMSLGLFFGNSVETHVNLLDYDNKFIQDWTLFYWAWWSSWAIFVGMFIAKVSKGRTFREFAIGVLFVPIVVSSLWFGVFGTAGQEVAASNVNATAELLQSPETTMFVLNEYLFQSGIVRVIINIITIVLVFSFFITSSDSGSIVVDNLASAGVEDTPKIQEVFWASMEGFLAISILVVGGNEALLYLQNSLIILGLPMSIIIIVSSILFAYQIYDDVKKKIKNK